MCGASSQAFRRRLDEARILHREGRLKRTRQAYEALHHIAPDDADLLGLMGVLALQESEPQKAEALLRRALELPADPRIRLRNLNNILALMKQQERFDDACALIGNDFPEWPRSAVPEASERATVMSLAVALAFFGYPDRAHALLEGVLPQLGEDDAEAFSLGGRVALSAGDPERAAAMLEQAERADPGNWQAPAALSAAYAKLARTEHAEAATLRAARAVSLHVTPARESQVATILVLNYAPRKIDGPVHGAANLHFRRNYISQLAARHGEKYRFASVFADLDGPLPDAPPADVVFNNMASGERMNMAGHLERARAVVGRIGQPVINHPDAVFEVTRQKNAERLRDVAGLRVPKIARYRWHASLTDVTVAEIERAFRYPLIVRHVSVDQSSRSLLSDRKTALRVHDRNELRSFIERQQWPEFYVIEYVDLRKPDGNFRKLRAMLFPDEVMIGSGGFYREWMVGGWRGLQPAFDFYNANPHLLTEMNRILLDPDGMLGSHVLPVLEEVRDRIPLDISGIDFDVDDEGRVVLFEAGATMNFLQRENTPAPYRMPEELDDRINAAFDRLIAGWTGRA